MKKIKKIVGINAVMIVILLTVMIYPLKPEINLKEKEVKLRWAGIYRNYTVYVDDNKEFTSPMIIKTAMKDYPIKLDPGVYFWKVKAGKMSSIVRKVGVNSDVSIKVEENTVENDGNVELNITMETPTGAFVLGLPYKEKAEIGRGNITAKQK